ncbi:AGAP007176-PA [Anopheles gambiae str. PEST]|uniref:AGAP007176-PA n=1 Tax=Anopheles gambiae TaxID=7165 RepID=A7URN3_ANOGA|nr:AGAP007176-PA [Anopheles gambiae str. PEST]
MSLRAIQKRDREKLSSSQRQQQQQQQQFISQYGVGAAMLPPSSGGVMTTTTTLTALKMTSAAGGGGGDGGGGTVPSVQSILQHQRAKRQNQHQQQQQQPTHTSPPALRRSSSYPTLLSSKRARKQQLRPVRSESDLRVPGSVDRTGGATGGGGDASALLPGSGNSFSTNNLYLGAKSEVCLKTLAVKNTVVPAVGLLRPVSSGVMLQSAPPLGSGGSVRSGGTGSSTGSRRLYESRRTSELSSSDLGPSKSEMHLKVNSGAVRIPIVGYEVMEERARFTIFKLRIENSISHTCWLVLRRYTDFVRLNNKLRQLYPHCGLVLPRKKWFGDNFSSGFIDNRIQGLQTFIDTILSDDGMRTCQAVRDFFCLDEPPSYSESMEESRVIFEAQEETIAQLKQQLQAKEDMVQALQTKLATELNRNAILTDVVRNSVENCAKCSKTVDQLMKESVYK